MTEKHCKRTNCPDYKTKGQGLGGVDAVKGRCMASDKPYGRMVSRLKACPKGRDK